MSLLQAIKNSPPERLARIEYQSHIFSIIGNLIVCIILITKGYWYIIFAFVFSLGISYSQAVQSYQKYFMIKSFIKDSYDPIKDVSFTRKRDYYIKKTFGYSARIISLLLSFSINYYVVGIGRWYWNIILIISFLTVYMIIYFFPFYWITKLLTRTNGTN